MPTEMVCPKCGSDMRTYERNGVVVDQCTECKGMFLDRGEFEQLASAEAAFYNDRGRDDRDDRGRDDRDRRDDDRRDDRGKGKPKKSRKKSFLENMMENLGE